jgi:ribosomal 30S subunit maturation factor RimM
VGDTTTPEPAAREFLHRIGRIIRAHGLSGDVLLQLFRSRPVETAQLKFHRENPVRQLELEHDDGRASVHDVVGVRWVSPSNIVMALGGVNTREDAERCIGAFVDIDPQDAPVGIADEVDRVFGARVVDVETERELGEIEDIRDNGAHAVLVVGPDEILSPWVDEFIDSVQEGADPVVRVRPIPGLLEANER